MKIEQNEFAQIVYLSRDDFVEEMYYDYLSAVGIGCSPKTAVEDFKTMLVETEGFLANKHIIFTIDSVWNQFSDNTKKVIMDHEFGHIAAGQLDSDRIQSGGGGAIVIEDWEFEADDYSAKKNGKEAVIKGLLETVAIFSKHPMYADDGDDLMKDPVLVKRLERLGYKA